MKLEAKLTLNSDEKMFANPRRMLLLAKIADVGSISKAAKLAGISYKAAWDAVDDMNRQSEQPLVERAVGGKGGGGANLTKIGHRLLKLYAMLEEIQSRALNALQDETVPLDSLLSVVSQFSAQSSARNQFIGTVSAISSQAVNDHVAIQLTENIAMVAEVTHSSSQRLGLVCGKEVMVMIKAPAVCVQPATEPFSAEVNCLVGTTVEHHQSEQLTEWVVDLGDGLEICGVQAAEKMASPFQAGEAVNIVVDAAQILLATIDES